MEVDMRRILLASIVLLAASRPIAAFASVSGWIGDAIGILFDVEVPFYVTTNLI